MRKSFPLPLRRFLLFNRSASIQIASNFQNIIPQSSPTNHLLHSPLQSASSSSPKNLLNLSFIQLDPISAQISHIHCTSPKLEFCIANDLQVRDLRQLESSSSSRNLQYPAAILSRGKGIFVNLIFTKALIRADSVKFFPDASPLSTRMELEAQSSKIDNPTFFQNLLDDLTEQIRTKSSNSQGFEMLVLECLLDHVSAALSRRLAVLQTSIEALLGPLERTVDRERLKALLLHNKALTNFQSIACNLRDAIEDLLRSPTDMQAMCSKAKDSTDNSLSNNSHNASELNEYHHSEQLELILEHFLRIIEELVGQVDDLLQDIQSTEGISNIVLDSQRNALLQMDLRLSMAGFALGIAGVGAGFFGMNLHSGLEGKPGAMATVAGVLSLAAAVVMGACWRKMNVLIKASQ